MACVRKRRGKWVADYRDPTGRRHWESFDTRKEAEAAVAGHTVAIRKGSYVAPNDQRTVQDAYDSWLRLSVEGADNKTGQPLRPTTRALYSMTWRLHVAPTWAAAKLRTVDAEQVVQWQQNLLVENGPKTVLNAVQILGALFRHARRFRWISHNPVEDVRKPKYKAKVRALTPDEIAALIANADVDTSLFVRIGASSGLRFGELAGLKWADVDLEKGIVSVRQQFTHGAWAELKTDNARRRVPLARELVRELRLHKLRTPGDLVFPASDGSPLDYFNWRNRVWLPLLKAAGVDGTFHMLRHSYATALIQAGESAKTVQTLVGHHSAAFTMDQYADVWPEQLERAGEIAARVLFASRGSKTVAVAGEAPRKGA
jgi:integrase